ncbi:TPA: hypothetical protein ACK3Q6_004077 [Burkholderia cepacia]|jgi:hypothetical protein|uniref:Uncharacterized protein n=3 Tax=Burkholderia cepacia complex TaxID=87882 RepID=A0A2S9PA98_9BURK|nr:MULTISPECIES: hypothetical protein [Burkholderia]KKL36494.1 hypothetical protein WR31_25270 [Burkholderia contaminans LMG 23361]MBA9831091.1 hypothetical protein [Burkholderia contaminans]MBA9839151.1 hypothetical protein [Burkholderia contaminans]MBA9864461.1 hypothetical protein [Burkholderia contaminans]MBA9906731.1 hypothetical protein [Burkholderia contaminans]
MSQSTEAGKLPGWTVLVSLLGCAIALMILLACRHIGLSWWIGVPAAIAVTVASVFLDRAIERRCAPSGRTN